MRHTFSLTLALFLLVWAFFTIDLHVGAQSKQASTPAKEERDFEASLSLDLEADYIRMLAAADNPAVETQLSEIDRQIKELEDMKRGFEARALRHDDQAQRLQFEDRAVLETRRHNELAEENRSKAQRVQQEIDRLQAEKRKLLQSD